MKLKLKRLLSAVLAAAVMPVMASVYADGLFDKTYDMTNEKPDGENGIVFTEEVPDGDYTVTVTTGGDTETRANIYINGGERVRAYTLEAGQTQDNVQPVVPKDGKIEVKVLGENPNVTEIKIEQIEDRTEPGEKTTIYIAGDSTAQTYDYKKVYPQTGWGQVFGDCFTDEVVVENRSMGGRSSKSYNNDGRLDRILTEMHPGDYVFIQFGINDGAQNKPERYISVPDYKELIKNKYIGEVEKRGGIPVLLTATAASWWDEENGIFMESRQDYADPTRELAEESGVAFVDINKIMTDAWNESAAKESVFDGYFICEPLESKAYPTGTDDHTHLKEKGARSIADMIADGIEENIPGLARYLRKPESFSDIDNHWCRSMVEGLALSGIVKGTGDNKFEPEKSVTRAEFLQMLMNVCGIPGHAYRDGECLEVKNDDWYCYVVQSALDKGLIPVAMIGDCKVELTQKVLAEATEDKEAVTTEISVYKSNGQELSFNGDKPITREEMAAFAMSAASYMMKNAANSDAVIPTRNAENTFIDADKISPEYIDGVEAAYNYMLINGMDDGSFRPAENVTRAQAASVICNLQYNNGILNSKGAGSI